MSVQEALQFRAVGLLDGVHDQRDAQPIGFAPYVLPWLVVAQGGKVIVECMTREEARREWKRLKGV